MIVHQLIMKDNYSWKSILNLSLRHFGMLLQIINFFLISKFDPILLKILGFPSSSVGKDSACSAGDPGSISGSGSFAGKGRRDRLLTPVSLGFPFNAAVKECTCKVGRPGSNPWVGKTP